MHVIGVFLSNKEAEKSILKTVHTYLDLYLKTKKRVYVDDICNNRCNI